MGCTNSHSHSSLRSAVRRRNWNCLRAGQRPHADQRCRRGRLGGDQRGAGRRQLRVAADGTWYVDIEGTHTAIDLPLRPLSLVVRLWRVGHNGLLRGSIRRLDSDQWIPLQSNVRLEELLRAWLMDSSSTP